MKISVVVPAFNEEKLIAESLRSMRRAMQAFTERGWEVELVVCDNNSNDRTAELARAEGALVVFEPVNQIGRARNCGAAAATGDWLVFIDADSQPSRELLSDVAEAIVSGRYVGGGSTVRLDDRSRVPNGVASFWNCISRVRRLMAGSFIFCQKSAFDQLGGFSLLFFAAEELEFSRRLKKLAKARGRKIVILHRHPLQTSARRMHLYSHRQHLRFLFRTVFLFGRTWGNREECGIWYDGKR